MGKASRDKVDADELRALLKYDPQSGVFTWIKPPTFRRRSGNGAGSINQKGYRRIGIRRRYYAAHRLAWLYMTGEWPSLQVDHINNDRADNRWANLRLATNSQNKANSPKRANTSSPLKGAFPRGGRWEAAITFNNKRRYLGLYATPEEAHAVYCAEAIRLFGQFARAA